MCSARNARVRKAATRAVHSQIRKIHLLAKALTRPGVAFSPTYGTVRDSRCGTLNANQSLRTFSTANPTRLSGLLPALFGLLSVAILLPMSMTIILSSTPRSAVGGKVVITRIPGAPQLSVTKSPKGITSSVCFCVFVAYGAVLIERPDAKWVINYLSVYE